MINTKKINLLAFYLLCVSILLLSGCADSLNIDNCRTPEVYGFWSGLWHGIIAPISF